MYVWNHFLYGKKSCRAAADVPLHSNAAFYLCPHFFFTRFVVLVGVTFFLRGWNRTNGPPLSCHLFFFYLFRLKFISIAVRPDERFPNLSTFRVLSHFAPPFTLFPVPLSSFLLYSHRYPHKCIYYFEFTIIYLLCFELPNT